MLHSAALGHLEVVGNELNLISVMPIDSQLPHTELRNHPWTAHSPRFACSVGRLHQLCRGLDDAQLEARSYCRDWSIAGTLSHLGLGADIMRRRLEDVLAGSTTPFDFAPSCGTSGTRSRRAPRRTTRWSPTRPCSMRSRR